MRGYLWFFFILLLPFAVNARNPEHSGLIGLVELPYTWEEEARKNRLGQTYKLWAAATSESPDIGFIEDLDEIETHEWSYEAPAAAVYAYHHDGKYTWYKLRHSQSGKFGWLKGSKQTTFHPLSELVSESLPYMTATWDRRIFGTVGDPDTAIVLNPRNSETPIAVAGSTMFEGKLWVLIVVLKDSVCSSSGPPRVLGSGWTPAHASSGQLNIWFYSRGC